jgi:hypothetical protein
MRRYPGWVLCTVANHIVLIFLLPNPRSLPTSQGHCFLEDAGFEPKLQLGALPAKPIIYTHSHQHPRKNKYELRYRPEFAVGTELELEKLVTELPLVSDIVAKIEIVAHFFPGIKHNYDIK